MNVFKIKSLTDVITNSSTEVFTVYNKEAANNIKELVNAILALNNETSNLTFDDLFEVDFDIDWELDNSTMMDIADTLKEKGYEEEAEYIGSYTPCSKKHEAATDSEFPDGFVDYNRNRRHDSGEGVIVWRGPWGNNGHATKNLDMNSWITDKS